MFSTYYMQAMVSHPMVMDLERVTLEVGQTCSIVHRVLTVLREYLNPLLIGGGGPNLSIHLDTPVLNKS